MTSMRWSHVKWFYGNEDFRILHDGKGWWLSDIRDGASRCPSWWFRTAREGKEAAEVIATKPCGHAWTDTEITTRVIELRLTDREVGEEDID